MTATDRYGDVSVDIVGDLVATVTIHRPPDNYFDQALIASIADDATDSDGCLSVHDADSVERIGQSSLRRNLVLHNFLLPVDRDFAAGQRTLPIALHLGRLAGTERTDFLQLLNSARQQEPARQRVRQLLRAGGELRRCAFIIEVYRQRALRLLREADPRDPAAGSLRELIGGISFFSTRPGSDPGKE